MHDWAIRRAAQDPGMVRVQIDLSIGSVLRGAGMHKPTGSCTRLGPVVSSAGESCIFFAARHT